MFCYTYYSFIYFLIFLFLLSEKNIFRKVFNLLRTTLKSSFFSIIFDNLGISLFLLYNIKYITYKTFLFLIK